MNHGSYPHSETALGTSKMNVWWEWTNLNSPLSSLANSHRSTCSWSDLFLHHESFWEQAEYRSQVWGGYPTIFTSPQCSDITRTPIILRHILHLIYNKLEQPVLCDYGGDVSTWRSEAWVPDPIDKQLWHLNRAPKSPYHYFFICKTDIKEIIVHLPHRAICEGKSEITGWNKMQGIILISRSGRNTKITDFLTSRKLPAYCFIWIFIPRIVKSPWTVPHFAMVLC